MSSSSDWEEVKRLASDFQRAQLTEAAAKLSERNCVEIVTKLLELKLSDVVFTNDGKEYVVPSHLTREITDELFVHGGRVALTDLVSTLNVSYSIIEARAHELVGSNRGLHLVLGQLLEDSTYIERIAQEINERLQQQGRIDVGELAKNYELPPEFLLEQIIKRLGTSVYGHQDELDSKTFFTEGYVSRNKARIRGILSAVCKPLSCSAIISTYGISDRLFYSITEELIRTNRISGSISGTRSSGKAVFTPDIYSKAQAEWVNNFYRQNGYLEYDSLSRLGISDCVPFIKKLFPEEKLLFLSSCTVGSVVTAQVDAAVEEALTSGGWVDLMPILPSVMSPEDGKEVLKLTLNSKTGHKGEIFCDTVLLSDQLIQNIKKSFLSSINSKAEEEVKSGSIAQFLIEQKSSSKAKGKLEEQQAETKKDKKDERRKRAVGGKGGGGTQGRETKTKSVKKKGSAQRARVDVESDEEDKVKTELEFLSVEELENVLTNNDSLRDCPEDELIPELAQYFYKPLNQQYTEIARNIHNANVASSSESRRKTHSQLVDKLTALLLNIRLFLKGLKLLDDDDLSAQLSRHLLKTLCSDIMNDVLHYLVSERLQTDVPQVNTQEGRQKLVNKLPEKLRPSLLSVNKSLSGSNVDDFLDKLDVALSPDHCDIILRKPDKKREKSHLLELKAQLIEQVSASEDHALILHLAVLCLYLLLTGHPIHASGKFVPALLPVLDKQLPVDASLLLHQYQDMVMKTLTEEDNTEAKNKLTELTPHIKDVVMNMKKQS